MRVLAGLRERHDVDRLPRRGQAAAHDGSAQASSRIESPPVDASLRLHPASDAHRRRPARGRRVARARAARRFGADVVHANSPRAGLIAAIARRLGCPPFVVRAHEHLPANPGRARGAVRPAPLRPAAWRRLATTPRRLQRGPRAPVAVRVYNSIDQAGFDPDRVDPAPIREELDLSPDGRLIGQVAQITPWKGAGRLDPRLAELRSGGHDAHLLLIGQVAFGGKRVRYDNHAFLDSLERLVDELGVRHAVHFLGQREDVPELLRARPLAAARPGGAVRPGDRGEHGARHPAAGERRRRGPELVDDGVTGRVVAPSAPRPVGAGGGRAAARSARLQLMGERSRPAASRFRDDVHASEMLAVYESARTAAGRQSGPARWRPPDPPTIGRPPGRADPGVCAPHRGHTAATCSGSCGRRAGAAILGWATTVSIQSACAFASS